MTKKLQNITSKVSPVITLILITGIWAVICGFELVPAYMLPSPVAVIDAFITDFPMLMQHSATTLAEAGAGLGIGIISAFITASIVVSKGPT